MDTENIEERIGRLEELASKIIGALKDLQRQVDEANITGAVFQQAVLIEIANALADRPPKNSEEYQAQFIADFVAKCESVATSKAEHWGGSEKRESELVEYGREMAKTFVAEVALLEEQIRRIRLGPKNDI